MAKFRKGNVVERDSNIDTRKLILCVDEANSYYEYMSLGGRIVGLQTRISIELVDKFYERVGES